MNKVLIAYYSRRGQNYVSGNIKDLKVGNTEAVAKMVQSFLNADLFQIETVEAYPEDYMETTEVAKRELHEQARPQLANTVAQMSEYDVIVLGYPNWWGTMPMAVYTFLESYDFAGKTIIPFCTHEGSGMGHSEAEIRRLCPSATVLSGTAIHGTSAPSARAIARSIADKAVLV